ncbi:MAG TPA: HAMP domain-containing sensor histidine kinase [Burkholderiales bacterium]|nr:HAMP domain-containing sensor histidine kinase [Burkholderiales bacterium]
MEEKKSLFNVLLDNPRALAGTLAVLLALAEILVDWATWVDLDVSALYSVPLVLVAVARNRRLLWSLALCLVAMTFAVYAAQIPSGAFSFHEPYFINRVLSAVTLALTAGMVHAWIVAADALAAQSRAVSEQNHELERLRQAAEEASGRKTQLLASVAHDIRSPLSIIEMTANLMRNAGDAAPPAEVLVKRLMSNARSLADLVSALVDISSLDAGRIPLQNSVFRLNDLLSQEGERLVPLARAKNLWLTIEAPDPPLSLQTDRIKLSRVLSNLVGNAIKFTETGSIAVSALLTPERAVLIRVKDTGVGMTAEGLEHIFDEYGQLGNPERDSNKGWGLGLAICRRLVGVMGGLIDVESAPDRGTLFTVRLPASCVVDG